MSAQGIHHVTLIVDDREQASRFYGDVLGMEEKSRPGFRFPGMFYHCGSQEVHLIIAARPLTRDDLYIQVGNGGDITRRYIHRHAAFLVPDIEEMKARLVENGVKMLFDPAVELAKKGNDFVRNMVEGWTKMYGATPLFFFDPFDNLLEFVPAPAA